MGTWDIGPFDNDTAADFSYTLGKTAGDECEGFVRSALMRATDTKAYLDGSEGAEAVAAAALIAAQCSGGEPVSPGYGAKDPVSAFPADLRMLAVEALNRVLAEHSELAELWAEASDGLRWRQSIDRLREILDPQIQPPEDVLFESKL
ncbi:DUF4259 domain-containing protein [Streptacidiphilus albus]|uniref:DUF4259 domain-containing protein n=1 Tax=Streptacidiphilus albus TaxID=105425 RepID=UPI00054AFC3F|nr:DUF4259 domain-containing protein [Streptacidiphilus albus]